MYKGYRKLSLILFKEVISKLSSVNNENKVLIGVMEINEAKRLRDKLAELGVEIDLIHNDETCRKGCRTSIEFWARFEDVQKVQELLQQEVREMINKEGRQIDHEQLDHVFDPEAKNTICPACGTEFSTDLKECPDCGLVFLKD